MGVWESPGRGLPVRLWRNRPPARFARNFSGPQDRLEAVGAPTDGPNPVRRNTTCRSDWRLETAQRSMFGRLETEHFHPPTPTYPHTHIPTYPHTHIPTYPHTHIPTYPHTPILPYSALCRSDFRPPKPRKTGHREPRRYSCLYRLNIFPPIFSGTSIQASLTGRPTPGLSLAGCLIMGRWPIGNCSSHITGWSESLPRPCTYDH